MFCQHSSKFNINKLCKQKISVKVRGLKIHVIKLKDINTTLFKGKGNVHFCLKNQRNLELG